jgi:AcrR family transcriptional regulator
MARTRRSRDDAVEVVVRRGVLNEARWEQILQAAANEFYEKGYKAARLQDIASRVGLLTGSLYYYIESKENLLFALVDTAYRRGIDAMAEDDPGAPAPDRLRAYIQRQLTVLEDAPTGSVVVTERDRKYLSAEHQAQVDAMRAQLRGFVTGIVEQGMVAGDFDPTVDVDLAVGTLIALLDGTREWVPVRSGASWRRVGDWYSRLFLRALAVPDAHTDDQDQHESVVR